MKTYKKWIVLAALFVVPISGLPYDQHTTHRDLTAAAFLKSSIATDPLVLLRTGFVQTIDTQIAISVLLQDGATAEDAGKRSLNHFYDVANDRPLTVQIPLGAKSPDWAL